MPAKTHARLQWLGVAAILSFVAAGCGTPPTRTAVAPSKPASPSPAPTAKAKVEIELRTVDIDGYNAEIAKHKGKVVLVDFWATYCPPCMKQFPRTVQLHEEYADKGLDVVSVSLDDESDEAKARTFLAEKKAAFANLRSEYGAGVESSEKFDLDKAVPHYRLYDRQGELKEKWDGEPEDLEAKIKELLKTE